LRVQVSKILLNFTKVGKPYPRSLRKYALSVVDGDCTRINVKMTTSLNPMLKSVLVGSVLPFLHFMPIYFNYSHDQDKRLLILVHSFLNHISEQHLQDPDPKFEWQVMKQPRLLPWPVLVVEMMTTMTHPTRTIMTMLGEIPQQFGIHERLTTSNPGLAWFKANLEVFFCLCCICSR
jgi:hypothetical protein